ncbi:MAG: N,N-dimethylformamidase beta subunit family domain-containing protein, partial [Tepidiformaceae bacterium]
MNEAALARVRGLALGMMAAASALVVAGLDRSESSAVGPCDPPIVNEIVCENSKPGNPESEWDLPVGPDASIEGYTTDISVDQGQQLQFKVKTNATNYRIDIYRLGYYGGLGGRLVATVQPSASLPQSQPACLNDAATGLVDCGNWAVSASWSVPA